MTDPTNHVAFAEKLRARLVQAQGESDPSLRQAVFRGASGDGTPIASPYDALAHQIGAAAYRVTDQMVADVRQATGSEKATFELVMAATIGAGLKRWDSAIKAIQEATDATH